MTERDAVAIRTDGIYIRRLEDSWSVIRFLGETAVVTATVVNVEHDPARFEASTRKIAGWLNPSSLGVKSGSFELDGETISFVTGERSFAGTVQVNGGALRLRWEGKRRWYRGRDQGEGIWEFSLLVQEEPPVAATAEPEPEQEADDPNAAAAEVASTAGLTLASEGNFSGAEAAFREADELGSAEGALQLGLLLEARGTLSPAVSAYARADERGSALGAYHYGMNVERTGGDKLESIRALVRAERRGYRQATAVLDQMVAPLPGEHPLSLESRRAAAREM